MSEGSHFVDGGKTVGPLDLQQMQSVLSKAVDPRNVLVWRTGFQDWKRAADIQELSALIDVPPPLPKGKVSPTVWRSAAAIGVAFSITWAVTGVFAALGGLPLWFRLDWATRRRQ
jgi:hypothetical protein